MFLSSSTPISSQDGWATVRSIEVAGRVRYGSVPLAGRLFSLEMLAMSRERGGSSEITIKHYRMLVALNYDGPASEFCYNTLLTSGVEFYVSLLSEFSETMLSDTFRIREQSLRADPSL